MSNNAGNPAAESSLVRARYSRAENVKLLLVGLAVFIAAYLLFTQVVYLALVVGPSMTPTLRNKQIVVMQRAGYEPERGDIVTFYSEPFNKNFIKRVIGVEGDVIDIQDGFVYRNGEQLNEPYVSSPTYQNWNTEFPLTVEEGCIFVLGDNRTDSRDSRWSGMAQVSVDDVVAGRILFKV